MSITMPVQCLPPKGDTDSSSTQAPPGNKRIEVPEKSTKPSYVHADDYEAKYPEDDYLEEAGSDARAWRVYLDEKRAEDESLLKIWRETVDVLLVFAALFSAVVTTFVVQSSQALQKDYTFVTASLLTELVAIQRAQAFGGEVASVPHSLVNVSSPFTADPLSTWVNGLWFISLSLSLSVALISVLIKQWLLHYPLPISGSPHEQVKVRQFRYIGLQDWWVPAIVGSLPVLLHLSLLIFLAGLVLFLHPLNVALPWVVLGLTGISYFIYFVTPLIPLKYPQCPYKSPLTEVAGKSPKFVYSILLLILERAALFLKYLTLHYQLTIENNLKDRLRVIRQKLLELDTSVQNQEKLAIRKAGELLTVQALETMRNTSSSPSLHNIALEAYSGLVDNINSDIHGVILKNKKLLPDLDDAFLSCFSFEDHSNAKIIDGKERKAERLGRAILRLQQGQNSRRIYDSRYVNCWNFLQEYEEYPQSMILSLLAKSAGSYYHKDYGYATLEVEDEAFIDICHQLLGRQLSSWAWNQLQEQVARRNLRECFATESDIFEEMKSRINKLPSIYETLHSKYTIMVLHSLGCPLRDDCPELRPQNRSSNRLLIHALGGVLEQCDHDTLMVFCQHLYSMIVIDLDWFDGDDEKYEEANNDSRSISAKSIFKRYQENLLAKLEADFETEMRNDDLYLNGLSSNGILIVPELCFELHHRIRADIWNKNLMLKALYCLVVGWDLTRSMAQFLMDCFDSGAHSNVVELFEEYNGLDTLLPHLAMEETREWARGILVHYYTAVAQKSPVDARRIFEYDFEDLRKNGVFPDVVGGVFQLLQSTWFKIFERVTGLRRRNALNQYPQIDSESFYPRDLTDNFKMILNLSNNYNEQDFWQHIIGYISKINKPNPPPFELRKYFISTFEAIEDLKKRVQAEGWSYDLYFSIPGEGNPVELSKLEYHISGPCSVKYGLGVLTHNAIAPIAVPSDSRVEKENALFIRPAEVARRLSAKVRNLVSRGDRSLPGNHPLV